MGNTKHVITRAVVWLLVCIELVLCRLLRLMFPGVCQYVMRHHATSLRRNDWTDRGPAWVESLGDLRNIVLDSGLDDVFNTAFAKLVWPFIPFNCRVTSHFRWGCGSSYLLSWSTPTTSSRLTASNDCCRTVSVCSWDLVDDAVAEVADNGTPLLLLLECTSSSSSESSYVCAVAAYTPE